MPDGPAHRAGHVGAVRRGEPVRHVPGRPGHAAAEGARSLHGMGRTHAVSFAPVPAPLAVADRRPSGRQPKSFTRARAVRGLPVGGVASELGTQDPGQPSTELVP